MTQRFYFDTSVFGGLYDIEFEKQTTLLFEKVSLRQIICVYSNLTESELSNAPDQVKDFFQNLKEEHKEVIAVTPEGLQLAQTYIAENVVGQTVSILQPQR